MLLETKNKQKKLFSLKIKQTVLASPFFGPYIGKDTELEMRFYSDHDRIENERRNEKGLNLLLAV